MAYSHLGADLFGDSKIIRPGTPLWSICGAFLRNRFGENLSTADAFSKAGIYSNPTAVKVTLFGPFEYERSGKRYTWIKDLWKDGQTAILSLDNLRDVTLMTKSDRDSPLITCENESPFYQLCQEMPDAGIIYTEGYPNAAVTRVIELLDRDAYALRHWGDTDVDGWRIAEQLGRLATISLFRCDVSETDRLKDKLIPMDDAKRRRARQILLNRPNFPYRHELEFALNRGWLEQEAWQSGSKNCRR